MQAYDSARFDPPAPIAFVTIASRERHIVIREVPMLLDTGADVTLLPRAHVESLVLPDAKQYELEAFDGSRSTALAVAAELQFLDRTFRGQFLITNHECGVMGRNVLNSLSLLFDGPARKWIEAR